MIAQISLALLLLCGTSLGQRSGSIGSGARRPFATPQSIQFQAPPPARASPSAPRQSGPLVEILRSNQDGPNEDGSYSFGFETSDGVKREEQGRLSNPETYVITGSYSYTAPDGTLVEVKYVADENGYRAESPLIPAIPEHSLAQIRAAQENPRPQQVQAPRAQTPPRAPAPRAPAPRAPAPRAPAPRAPAPRAPAPRAPAPRAPAPRAPAPRAPAPRAPAPRAPAPRSQPSRPLSTSSGNRAANRNFGK